VTVVKDNWSYREDVFTLPHTKLILLSDLEVFEVKYVHRSGLVMSIAEDRREKMVGVHRLRKAMW
jgi:hypothetical protein